MSQLLLTQGLQLRTIDRYGSNDEEYRRRFFASNSHTFGEDHTIWTSGDAMLEVRRENFTEHEHQSSRWRREFAGSIVIDLTQCPLKVWKSGDWDDWTTSVWIRPTLTGWRNGWRIARLLQSANAQRLIYLPVEDVFHVISITGMKAGYLKIEGRDA